MWKLSLGALRRGTGFYAQRGAQGVSSATTQAVVLCSVLILVWDYFLTSLLF